MGFDGGPLKSPVGFENGVPVKGIIVFENRFQKLGFRVALWGKG